MAKELLPERHLRAIDMERKMTNLKIDPSSKGFSGGVAVSKVVNCPTGATSDSTGCAKQSDVDHEYQMPLQGMYYPADGYYGYYYPGFDGSYGEWDDQGYFLGSEGFELQYPLIQADNGSVLYYTPDPSLGYSPYHPYWPGAMVGMDGQYMAQQPSSVFSQPLASQGYCPYPIPFGSEVFPTYPLEATAVYGDGVHGNGLVVGTTAPSSKPNYTSMRTFAPTKSTSPSKSSIPQERDTSPALELPPNNPPARAQNKVLHNGSGFPATTVLAKDYFPISKLQGKGGVLLYPDTSLNIKTDGRGWVGPEKLKAGGKANNVRDVYREQKPDSQTNGAKSTLLSGVIPVAPEGNANSNNLTTLIHRDQNNLAEFSTKYDHALFYVIKSYSEDDIHKSIKYGVWASTPNGNKRLDGAFQNAQQKMEEEGFKCPIFLFFSVNASCQFCGVAEMIGRVEFNKKMDFWQQDKWTGCFPVKWHIIKDVPNAQFRHILLENNDNKPVTNSRDTQEVKFTQGIEMLNIVKNYSSKTSILDDFGFYESREKAMQERKIRLFTPHLEHLQKRPDGVVVAKAAGDLKPAGANHQSIDFASGKKNE